MLRKRTIPFGYCMINGRYEINPIEAKAVKTVFAEYISGHSIKAIAAEMTVPYNENKSEWNKNMVSRVIENRRYIGENDFPQMVAKEEFELANQIKISRCNNLQHTKRNIAEPPQGYELLAAIYYPTDAIIRLTNEINRLIDTPETDTNDIREKIFKCAAMKYAAIIEERSEHNVSTNG